MADDSRLTYAILESHGVSIAGLIAVGALEKERFVGVIVTDAPSRE